MPSTGTAAPRTRHGHHWQWPVQGCVDGGVLHYRDGRAWVTLTDRVIDPDQAADTVALTRALSGEPAASLAALVAADAYLAEVPFVEADNRPKMVAAGLESLTLPVRQRRAIAGNRPGPGPRARWEFVAATFDRDDVVRARATAHLGGSPWDLRAARRLAADPAVNLTLLARIMDPEYRAKGQDLLHRNREIEDLLWDYGDLEVRVDLAEQTATVERIEQAGTMNPFGMRIAAAKNRAAPAHLLERLARDTEAKVRLAAAAHPNTPGPGITALLSDKFTEVRAAAVASPLLGPSEIDTAATDRSVVVRRALAARAPRLTQTALERLLDDKDATVAGQALRRLDAGPVPGGPWGCEAW